MALPALSEIRVLKIAVEVGLVVGRMAATTPTGTPIFDQLLVRQFAQHAYGLHAAQPARQDVAVQQVLGDLVLGVAVAGLFHRQLGQLSRVGPAAAAIRSTMASTCSWEYF